MGKRCKGLCIRRVDAKVGIDVENTEKIAENVIKKISDDSWKK